MKNLGNLGFFAVLLIISASSLANKVCKSESIKQIESYISSLTKVALPFTQIHEGDENVKGLLLIEKPLKFRVNYDKPHPFVIAGGKNFVSVYDYSLDELSRIDAKDNMFRFLLEFDTKIEKNVKILGCEYHASNLIIELLHLETEQKAKITFLPNPAKIKNLIIPDDGNNYDKGFVKMEFTDALFVNNIPAEFFILKEPKIYGKPKRFSSLEILEKLEKK
jgi:outer membrane lipoprotein-sorting protein